MTRVGQVIASLALLLAACGDLDTAYGVRTGESLNGVRVLHDALAARTSLRDAWLLTPALDDADLLVYVATDHALPDAEASLWLQDWLAAAKSPRQVLIVVRDGNVTGQVCRRWAAEKRRSGQAEAAARLEARARAEQDDHVEVPEIATDTDLFLMVTQEVAPVTKLDGLGLADAPTTLTLGAWLDPEDDGEVLIRADGKPFAVSWPIGDQGELLVVANATGLVDGALPDPRARQLLQALLDEVLRYQPQPTPNAVWLGSLRVRDAEPPELNMLSFLTMSPFAWPLWHLLVLLLVVVLARAAWLGRREARQNLEIARFSRHVDALAGHMARAAAHDPTVAHDAATALAAATGRAPPPDELPTADAAVAWLHTLAEVRDHASNIHGVPPEEHTRGPVRNAPGPTPGSLVSRKGDDV